MFTPVPPPMWLVLCISLLTVVAAVWALYERAGKVKLVRQKITDQDIRGIVELKDDIIAAARDAATTWKEKWEAQHAEFKAYREEVHTRNNILNDKLVEQASLIADLQARTDYSPLMSAVQKISESQESTAHILTALYDRIIGETPPVVALKKPPQSNPTKT